MHLRNIQEVRGTIVKEANGGVEGNEVKGNWNSNYFKALWAGSGGLLEGFEQRNNMISCAFNGITFAGVLR